MNARILRASLILIVAAAAAPVACAQTAARLHDRAVRESLTPVRPGTPGKAPFWNERARQFMFAPAFDFKKVPDASSYQFTVSCEGGETFSFEAFEPWAPLSPIWAQVPPGSVSLKVEALSRRGAPLAIAGTRNFHRAAVFDGPYAKPALPYGQSASTALSSVIHEPFVQHWRASTQPDPRYPLYRYASKIIGSLMSGCAMYATEATRPTDAKEAIAIARRAADFLILNSAPPKTPLEYFPPTYHGATPTDRENDNWTMMMTPAEAGQGYLDLYNVTQDAKYLQAARRIAATYTKLQDRAGTWPLKVDNRTGAPLTSIELIPTAVITFLERLGDQYGFHDDQPTLDRAVRWVMSGPMRTMNWQAQFDDEKLRGEYQNLSKHEACEFAGYLLRHRGTDAPQRAAAIELIRFAEDQFVVWEHPPDFKPRSPALSREKWYTPCSLEQYAMFEPISGSSAALILAFCRAYDATADPLDLAKAASLANALTQAQLQHNGRYPTRMIRQDLSYWINSTINTARALNTLAKTMQHKPAPK
jgi:maltose/maltodextrin transport system substrate-binding protein